MNLRSLSLALCLSVVACSTASAHPQHGLPAAGGPAAGGFSAGLVHPLLGLDHLLAMIAVGLLSVQSGGRAVWVLPASFLGMMLLGAAAGFAGIALPMVEIGVALSVIVLGAALAVGRNRALLAASFVIGGFALFHGHAHGTEMPAMAAPALYAAGLAASSTLLLLAGIAGGLFAASCHRREALRLSGAAIACAGLCLLAGLL